MTLKAVKSRLLKAIHGILTGLHDMLYGFVLHFFKMLHLNIGSKLTLWYMEQETSEHFRSLVKVFKWIILPASLFYFIADFYFFGKNSLSSILWNFLIFFYSQFLPDLPSIFRQRKADNKTESFHGYQKYVLLLFAPLLIWILFSGIKLN